MPAYYNEIEPYAAQWIRNLIAAGHIAPGDVDERSIEDIKPDDLAGYAQCHFFAGVGVWSYALRLAGWPDDRPVWTGSCPCQPFSSAGKGAGFADERHLWPAFLHLIEERRPECVLGEQVASKDGLAWLDLVQSDLEGAGYASGAVDLCAAGVGAPHIRQRLWWMADDAEPGRLARRRIAEQGDGRDASRLELGRLRDVSGLADSDNAGLEGRPSERQRAAERTARSGGVVGGLEHADVGQSTAGTGDAGEVRGLQEAQRQPEHGSALSVRGSGDGGRPGPTNGRWGDVDWLLCRDERWRPVEPGTFPLAHGAPARVGRLRAYGNAINAEAAKEFVTAVMAVRP